MRGTEIPTSCKLSLGPGRLAEVSRLTILKPPLSLHSSFPADPGDEIGGQFASGMSRPSVRLLVPNYWIWLRLALVQRAAVQVLANVAGSSRLGVRGGYSSPLNKPAIYRRLSSCAVYAPSLTDCIPLDVLCPSLTPLRAVRRFRRIHTTSRNRNSTEPSSPLAGLPSQLDPSQRKAYGRLRPVIDSFAAPIDWAVAYGSGVVHQANASADTVSL